MCCLGKLLIIQLLLCLEINAQILPTGDPTIILSDSNSRKVLRQLLTGLFFLLTLDRVVKYGGSIRRRESLQFIGHQPEQHLELNLIQKDEWFLPLRASLDADV
jgi:hypothetical protein